MIDLARLFDRLPGETARALVEQGRITTPGFERELLALLSGQRGDRDGVLAQPLLEGAFPWLAHPQGWAAADKLLHPKTLELLKAQSFAPYAHQVEAWSHLVGDEIRSAIISSGTGSGKTECFLTPILDRLIQVSDGGEKRLSGVRALMLYPLNALINSQEERLNKWLSPFGGRLRYCLYNGATPNEMQAVEARQHPERVGDRKALRADPPPILVTNITMLEYMLIRNDDAPILAQSQRKLDFVVLDEAHSYVGAQAAELSLLLRRVAAAFGQVPEDIRFVATSATIGDGADRTLGDFLADIAGVNRHQVQVITGQRAQLSKRATSASPLELGQLRELSEEQRAKGLFDCSALENVRSRLRDGEALSWPDWEKLVQQITGAAQVSKADALEFLGYCLEAKLPVPVGDDERFMPLRVHLFHKTLLGIWVCPNPCCGGAAQSDSAWPFGAISTDDREHCRHCESVMFEWVSCRTCGDGCLLADESSDGLKLSMPARDGNRDDFLQEIDREESGDDAAASLEYCQTGPTKRYLGSTNMPGKVLLMELSSGVIVDEPQDGALELRAVDELGVCPHCQTKLLDKTASTALRPLIAGSPYLTRQLVPTLLPLLSAREGSVDAGLPARGRQLITFTDARQGTAKHASSLQVATERDFVRGYIYHAVQHETPGDPAEAENFRSAIEALSGKPGMAGAVASLQDQLNACQGGREPVAIEKLIANLAAHPDVRGSLRDLWADRSDNLSDPGDLAEFLLLREVARRPKFAASGETLGLFRLRLQNGARPLSAIARELGLDDKDWDALQHLCLTHNLRQNQMITVRHPGWMKFAQIRGGGRFVVPTGEDIRDAKKQKRWPGAYGPNPGANYIVSLVAQALNLSFSDRVAREKLSELFESVLQALRQARCLATDDYGYRLDWTKLAVEAVTQADICPTTRRPLPASFRGLSLYADSAGIHRQVRSVEFPPFPYSWLRDIDGAPVSRSTLDDWLVGDGQVQQLRAEHCWDLRTDRAVRYDGYFRTAEHSAQIPSERLIGYEGLFRAGKINVLSCSTTMEMGVDIGEVEAVLMTNAPPSIANYKQRVGRAGRRGQPVSLAVTICKDRPLDRAVARDPVAYFNTQQRVPRVSLDSAVIAQRHVNAMLLARFLKTEQKELHKLTVGSFFGLVVGVDGVPMKAFLAWLDREAISLCADRDLEYLLRGTKLSPGADVLERSRDRMETIAENIRAEWMALGGGTVDTDDAASRARSVQRGRIEKEYLLSALSGQGFLPAYGFPTGVVQFWTETRAERLRREKVKGEVTSFEDRRFLSRGMPARPRNIAIFEFAPGNEVVVDGLVRLSAGLTLNWKRPQADDGVREVQSLRSVHLCKACGALRAQPSAVNDDGCSRCTSRDSQAINFIVPAGFSVDTSIEVSDSEAGMEYTQRNDAWVAASAASWNDLPDPSLGRTRVDPDGLVFDFNPGPAGAGFAICLQCGRAAPEAERGGELPHGLVEHQPLRWVPDWEPGSTCSGNNKPFSVQRNISLGEETRTSVFEIQLRSVRTRETALAIALALREVNARALSIDPSEMGVAAMEGRDADGVAVWSAAVYDRASGGAGFASAIALDPIGTLQRAAQQLDCTAPGKCGDACATRICPTCVLTPDSQMLEAVADRVGAFEALTDASRRLNLPAKFKMFGEGTHYEPLPIDHALGLYLEHDPTAQVFIQLGGDPDAWQFEEWSLHDQLRRFTARGGRASLVIRRDALKDADAALRASIVLNCQRMGCEARAFDEVVWPGDAAVLALTDGGARVWGCQDSELAVGANWASTVGSPAVRADIPGLKLELHPIELASLLAQGSSRSIKLIADELDAPVIAFGTGFKALCQTVIPNPGALEPSAITRLVIQDRYIYSPLAVRLYAEICRTLAGPDTQIEIRTRGASRQLEHRRPYHFAHDWPEISQRNVAIKRVFEAIGAGVKLDVTDDVSHRRTIDLVGSGGRSTTIVLDQGVGAWRTPRNVPFDFFSPMEEQLRRIELNFLVQCQPGGSFIGALEEEDELA